MNNVEKQKRKIREFFITLQDLFQVGNLENSIKWMAENDGNVAAEITFEEKYQRISIKIFPMFLELPQIEQRKALLHEMCHLITIPLTSIAKDLLDGRFRTREEVDLFGERSTSQIEDLLDFLLCNRFKTIKKKYKAFLE